MKLLGLDVGEKRIGVAKADSSVKIAVPVGALAVDGSELANIAKLVKLHNAEIVVVGMPRNLQGQTTQQSEYTKAFVKRLNKYLLDTKPTGKTIKIFFQDESLTSVQAKANLKSKNVTKKSGVIDAESATIILQDFIENIARRLNQTTSPAIPNSDIKKTKLSEEKTTSSESAPETPQFKPYSKDPTKKWRVIRFTISSMAVVAVVFFFARALYGYAISPVRKSCELSSAETSMFAEDILDPCMLSEFTVEDGETVSSIADSLKRQGLIRSSLAFRLFVQLSNSASDLKAGTYQFSADLSVDDIVSALKEGTSGGLVFRFTMLPGETLQDFKRRLIAIGYPESDIDSALEKTYDHPVLSSKPADASLEGYLFGETYEFYTSDSVEKIISRMLDELYIVVQKNNLEQKFNQLGLTLHEGIILSSIVQKEAGTLAREDQQLVASVFYNRLNLGISLGSDVTVKYALDQIDPERTTYTDNAAALKVDSCYNTRLYAGLPCGPISNPSALTLINTANPADSSYLYFLTGDDGMMYYSSTESEHVQNTRLYCVELCNVSL